MYVVCGLLLVTDDSSYFLVYFRAEIMRRLRCVPKIKYEPKLWTHKSQEVKTAKTRKTSTYEWRMRAVDAVDILDDELVID